MTGSSSTTRCSAWPTVHSGSELVVVSSSAHRISTTKVFSLVLNIFAEVQWSFFRLFVLCLSLPVVVFVPNGLYQFALRSGLCCIYTRTCTSTLHLSLLCSFSIPFLLSLFLLSLYLSLYTHLCPVSETGDASAEWPACAPRHCLLHCSFLLCGPLSLRVHSLRRFPLRSSSFCIFWPLAGVIRGHSANSTVELHLSTLANCPSRTTRCRQAEKCYSGFTDTAIVFSRPYMLALAHFHLLLSSAALCKGCTSLVMSYLLILGLSSIDSNCRSGCLSLYKHLLLAVPEHASDTDGRYQLMAHCWRVIESNYDLALRLSIWLALHEETTLTTLSVVRQCLQTAESLAVSHLHTSQLVGH